MKQYLELVRDVLENGEVRVDRTETGTLAVFGRQLKYDLTKGFPLMTTKKVHLKSIIYELLFFLQGETNTKYLNDNGVTIWNGFADENGDLGPIYGSQWRKWKNPDGTTTDQITELIEGIKSRPFSRRHIFHAWHVSYLPDETKTPQENVKIGNSCLAPCHLLYQFYVSNDKKLTCSLYLRSNDLFLGNPFNTASCALLTSMIAQQCDLDVGKIILWIGDAHIYLNHIEQVKLQLERTPTSLPKLIIKRKAESIFDYKYEDFEIIDYNPQPAIKAPISI